MSMLRKMKRAKAKPEMDKARKQAKDKYDEAVKYEMTLRASKAEAVKVQDTRVAVLLMCFVYVMHYELHADEDKLRRLPEYIDELDWYLHHDVGPGGKVIDRPMFRITDTLPQIRKEKHGYIVDVRTAWDMKDEIQVAIVTALVGLELKLMWIVCTKFPGIGKVKLGKLQQRMHEMERDLTFTEAVELKRKLKNEINFTFDDFNKYGEESFGQWLWNEHAEGPTLKETVVKNILGGRCAG